MFSSHSSSDPFSNPIYKKASHVLLMPVKTFFDKFFADDPFITAERVHSLITTIEHTPNKKIVTFLEKWIKDFKEKKEPTAKKSFLFALCILLLPMCSAGKKESELAIIALTHLEKAYERYDEAKYWYAKIYQEFFKEKLPATDIEVLKRSDIKQLQKREVDKLYQQAIHGNSKLGLFLHTHDLEQDYMVKRYFDAQKNATKSVTDGEKEAAEIKRDYMKAQEKGSISAAFELSKWDRETAKHFQTKAAEGGHWYALSEIGQEYERSNDVVLAAAFYRLAAVGEIRYRFYTNIRSSFEPNPSKVLLNFATKHQNNPQVQYFYFMYFLLDHALEDEKIDYVTSKDYINRLKAFNDFLIKNTDLFCNMLSKEKPYTQLECLDLLKLLKYQNAAARDCYQHITEKLLIERVVSDIKTDDHLASQSKLALLPVSTPGYFQLFSPVAKPIILSIALVAIYAIFLKLEIVAQMMGPDAKNAPNPL